MPSGRLTSQASIDQRTLTPVAESRRHANPKCLGENSPDIRLSPPRPLTSTIAFGEQGGDRAYPLSVADHHRRDTENIGEA